MPVLPVTSSHSDLVESLRVHRAYISETIQKPVKLNILFRSSCFLCKILSVTCCLALSVQYRFIICYLFYMIFILDEFLIV